MIHEVMLDHAQLRVSLRTMSLSVELEQPKTHLASILNYSNNSLILPMWDIVHKLQSLLVPPHERLPFRQQLIGEALRLFLTFAIHAMFSPNSLLIQKLSHCLLEVCGDNSGRTLFLNLVHPTILLQQSSFTVQNITNWTI